MTAAEKAPAKINLALHVRRRRPDGYHDIETLFAFVDVADRVEAEAGADLSLDIVGPEAGVLRQEGDGPENLVLRAARALRDAAGLGQGARLKLYKHLPVASGIGGGSADAAATLRLLNRLWGLGWSLDQLAPVAAELGADVPACLYGRTARGDGVGTVLRFPETEDLGRHWALLANAHVPVSTAAVFRSWDGIDRGALGEGHVLEAARTGRNDLEPPALALAPQIGLTLSALSEEAGAMLVRMSGSGATCFALFDDGREAAGALARLRARYPGWWIEMGHLL